MITWHIGLVSNFKAAYLPLECDAPLQQVCKFFGQSAVDSSKSADPIVHRDPSLLKNLSNGTGNFKNIKSVGVP
jgi:hypothetical protein